MQTLVWSKSDIKKAAKKKKPAKTPDKKKPVPKPDKPKKSEKKAAALKATWLHMENESRRNNARTLALTRAAHALRTLGYEFERGSSLLILHSQKLMLAFDVGDSLLKGIQRHAAISRYNVVEISGDACKSKRETLDAVLDAIAKNEPNCSRKRTNGSSKKVQKAA